MHWWTIAELRLAGITNMIGHINLSRSVLGDQNGVVKGRRGASGFGKLDGSDCLRHGVVRRLHVALDLRTEREHWIV